MYYAWRLEPATPNFTLYTEKRFYVYTSMKTLLIMLQETFVEKKSYNIYFFSFISMTNGYFYHWQMVTFHGYWLY